MEVTVDNDGRVLCVQALSGHPLAITHMIEASRRWKFKPYLKNGSAQRFCGRLRVVRDSCIQDFRFVPFGADGRQEIQRLWFTHVVCRTIRRHLQWGIINHIHGQLMTARAQPRNIRVNGSLTLCSSVSALHSLHFEVSHTLRVDKVRPSAGHGGGLLVAVKVKEHLRLAVSRLIL